MDTILGAITSTMWLEIRSLEYRIKGIVCGKNIRLRESRRMTFRINFLKTGIWDKIM